MSDDASRPWKFYIDDMIGFADKVLAYTNGLDQERFVRSGLNYGAPLRNLELIGEAAAIYRSSSARNTPKLPGACWSPPAIV